MAKNIILCSDGTGNTAIKGRGTNVFKVFEAVDLNEHRTNPQLDTQLAFYDDGVGTNGSVFVKALGNATGFGLAANVKQLYRELSRVYDFGDPIFLFGFSRGAFTVRTLADMIGVCGVLKGETFETAGALRAAVDAAYTAYRANYNSVLSTTFEHLLRRPDGPARLAAFKQGHELHPDVPITFVGVWDTVDAVGLPFAIADWVNRWLYQFKFPDRLLGKHVGHAAHALSLDDNRRAFEPVLWESRPGDDRITQVWFAGVHSNVGGGYPKQGMSLVALDWMLVQAERHGLRLQALDHELFRGHASVDDMLYNPRAGFGVFYRWAPRDVRAYCRRSGVEPLIHLTAAERIAHGTDDYAPGNIPPETKVAYTPPHQRDTEAIAKERLLKARADAITVAIQQAHDGRYLLDEVRDLVRGGNRAYWLFVLGWATLLVLAGALLEDVLRDGHVELHWWVSLPLGIVALLFLWAGSQTRRVNTRMGDAFSHFWHKYQPALRAELKRAHATARATLDVDPPGA